MSRERHDACVSRLSASLLSAPVGTQVRLAKPGSNLFRFGKRDRVLGLDASGLDTVLSINPAERTVEVGGLITYERLVAATLPHRLMPKVVPQLKTITVGGAVAGLGIESSSFRAGLPHESVREMDILTGSGDVVTVTDADPLFTCFPNSYGTLGYAVRLVLELAPVEPAVELRHIRFNDPTEIFTALDELWDNPDSIDFCDGVIFSESQMYLSVGKFSSSRSTTSNYTDQSIFYRSIPYRSHDLLSTHDYLWRWDTDWFWCSKAFGAQNPVIRRFWPAQYRRSDIYRRIVAWDRRVGMTRAINNIRGRRSESVVQDVEIPLAEAAAFLRSFCAAIPIRPIWLCPLAAIDERQWPLYPLPYGQRYINFGFWATVPLLPSQPDDHMNRLVETLVDDHGGHKSLYSTVHYDRERFWQNYDMQAYRSVKNKYDPDGKLPDLFDKVVGDNATR